MKVDSKIKEMERDAKRIKKLLSKETLNERELELVLALARAGGQPPPASGWDERGQPFWDTSDIREWFQGDKVLRIRSVADIDRLRTAETGSVRASSWDASSRTFEAVIATEAPVLMYDPRGQRVIREVLLASGADIPKRFPLLRDHKRDTSNLVGECYAPRRVGTKWLATCRVATTTAGSEIAVLVSNDYVSGMSSGYSYKSADCVYIERRQSKVVDGRTFSNDFDEPMCIVKFWKLHEVSVTPFPADVAAKIRSGDGYQAGSERREGNEMLVKTPAIHSRNSITRAFTRGELTAALLLHVGHDASKYRVQRAEEAYRFNRVEDPRQLARDAEEGSHLAEMDITRIIWEAMRLDGFKRTCPPPAVVCQQLYQNRYKVRSVDGLFEDVIATLVLARFDDGNDSTQDWCDESETSHLKTASNVLLSPVELDHVPRGGHAEKVEFATTTETSTIARYAGWFEVEEHDLMDGSLEERMRVFALAMSDSAKSLRPTLVYALLLANPTMADGIALFHADHGNLLTSSGLAGSTLDAAIAEMAQQTYDTMKLNLDAKYLIIPQALRATAAGICQGLELRDPRSTSAPVVKADSRLDTGVTHPETKVAYAGSETSWYMANGSQGVVVRYRTGSGKVPVVRMSRLHQARWGYSFDVRFDVGASLVGYRGLLRADA